LVQSLRQAQIFILEILNVFLWLKFSPSLTLDKYERFETTSGEQPVSFVPALATLIPLDKAKAKIFALDFAVWKPRNVP
jgi:hypothetical protein